MVSNSVRAWIFFRSYFQLPGVLSCEDLLISSIHRSANIWISYFKSRTGLNFFQVLFKTTRFSSVLSCEDLLISGIKSWFNSNWIRQSLYNSFSCWWRSCKKYLLLESFLAYLSSDERELVNLSLNGKLDKEQENEWLDLLERFNWETVPKAKQVKDVVLEIAHKEVIKLQDIL